LKAIISPRILSVFASNNIAFPFRSPTASKEPSLDQSTAVRSN
jgi:hypothetical protein